MKNTLLFVLLLFFLGAYSQNKNQRITVNLENDNLKTAIEKIESVSNYKFFFLDTWLTEDVTVSGNYANEYIDTILKDIFKRSDINFFIYNNTTVILTKNNVIYDELFKNNSIVIDSLSTQVSDKVIVNNAKDINPVFTRSEEFLDSNDSIKKIGKETKESVQAEYKLSGFIKNKAGEPLENVTVAVRGKNIGTNTNKSGYYEINLKPGNYVILTSSLNTRRTRKSIVLYNNGTLDFEVDEFFETLSEVNIDAEADRNVKEAITGIVKINVKEIKNIPLVLGERDILKVATTLPGISNTGEGSNGYNVRGGKTDQNLILLDNAAIYNPSHFFGIFSALNPFTTGDVNIYKGNLPSEYGGRLSSVFDITTKDANTEKFAGEVSIGPVTGNITLELPIVKEKSGLMVGGRSTYSNWILRSLDEEELKNSQASFFDVIAKYNHKINDKNDFSATAYYSKDNFSITSDSLFSYSNRLLSVNWRSKLNKKHNAEFILTNSEYQFDIEYDGDFSNDFQLNYKNTESEFKAKFDYKYDDTKNFTYGVSAKLYSILPGDLKPLNNQSLITEKLLEKEKGLEAAAFVAADIDVSEKLAVNAGLRYSNFSFLGPATQRIYTDGLPLNVGTLESTERFGNNEFIKTYGGLESRASARYLLDQDFSVKASYNNSFQYIHTLSTNTTVSPTDTWKLSDLNIEPQRAEQISLGFYKNWKDNMYEVSLEGYYKKYKNILDYKVGANLLLNEALETEVLQGDGKAYGVEFLIKKSNGRFNGWLGYTYSRTFIKLDSPFAEETVNNGQFFPANYDKPHDFSAVMNYKLTQRFSFSANFAYQTGRPITYPVGNYVLNGAEYVLYSDRNEFRIPDYYRLDISFNVEGNHKIKKFAHSFWNISIYNVLGRNNPYSQFFVTENGQVKAYQSSIFSIPIPTITYNFRF